ncbi:MAG TPA: MarR family transcriptional regulator [Solirubrobacteraceae bacterium]|nr:MarR family transcriptional regulator [Solirubrobacteraceae bacterium]
MQSGTTLDRLNEVAAALPLRVAALNRLFLKRTSVDLARTEASVMAAIADGPRRITDLACATGVTQPAMTLLVNRLQERGLVSREPDPDDRRAVRVALTPPGVEIFGQLQEEYRALLHREMASLAEDDVEVLARATQVIDRLIARLED